MKARFVAKAAAYTHGAIAGNAQYINFKGDIVPAQRRVDANFQNTLVTNDDAVVGLTQLHHTGLPMWEDTEEDLDGRSRLSVWDSEWAAANEGFAEYEIEAVITALRNSSDFGSDFVEIIAAQAPKPWPTYDEMDEADDIAQLVTFLGLEPGVVVKYELENKNRPEVIEALLATPPAKDGDSVVVNAG